MLPNRAYLPPWIKNALGIRGPTPIDVPPTLQMVASPMDEHIDLDDYNTYFVSSIAQAAVAAQNSFVVLAAAASVRVRVDGIIFNFQPTAGGQTYTVGVRATSGIGVTQVGRTNIYPAAITASSNLTGLLLQGSGSTAAALGGAALYNIAVPLNVTQQVIIPQCFAGGELIISSGVNQPVSVTVWGKILPFFPE